MTRLLIVGAGGHGRAIAEAVLHLGHDELVGFIDDDASRIAVWERPVLGTPACITDFRQRADSVIVAVGNNAVREALHARVRAAGFELLSVIHPHAIVSARAVIGAGCAIMAGAVVGTEAQLGEGVIVNSGAVVDHHCVVEDFGHVGTNASMAGGSRLGRGAWMQAGSALGYRVSMEAGRVLEPGRGMTTK